MSTASHFCACRVLGLWVCIALSTVPQKLLEFRYFILPYLFVIEVSVSVWAHATHENSVCVHVMQWWQDGNSLCVDFLWKFKKSNYWIMLTEQFNCACDTALVNALICMWIHHHCTLHFSISHATFFPHSLVPFSPSTPFWLLLQDSSWQLIQSLSDGNFPAWIHVQEMLWWEATPLTEC